MNVNVLIEHLYAVYYVLKRNPLAIPGLTVEQIRYAIDSLEDGR